MKTKCQHSLSGESNFIVPILFLIYILKSSHVCRQKISWFKFPFSEQKKICAFFPLIFQGTKTKSVKSFDVVFQLVLFVSTLQFFWRGKQIILPL